MNSSVILDHVKSSYLMSVERLSGQVESLAASTDELFHVSDDHRRPALSLAVETKTNALRGLQVSFKCITKIFFQSKIQCLNES